MEPPLTRAPSTPRPSRAFQDMDLPRLARLLDASSVLGPCRDLATLGPTLFKLLREELPVDRLALWFGEPEEGLEVIQWAARLEPDGVLTMVEPVAGLVEHTRNLQEDLWSLEAAGATGRADAGAARGCGGSSRPWSCSRCAPRTGWWAA